MIPETIAEFKPIKLKPIINNYKIVFSNWKFIFNIQIISTIMSFGIVFNVLAPFYAENILHYSAIGFGQVALLIGGAFFGGNLTNRFLAEYDSQTKTKWCAILMLISTVIGLATSFMFDSFPLLVIFTLITVYLGAIIFPNYLAHNLAMFPEMAATAGALSSGTSILFSSFWSSSLGALLHPASSFAIALGIAILVIVFSIFVILERAFAK